MKILIKSLIHYQSYFLHKEENIYISERNLFSKMILGLFIIPIIGATDATPTICSIPSKIDKIKILIAFFLCLSESKEYRLSSLSKIFRMIF